LARIHPALPAERTKPAYPTNHRKRRRKNMSVESRIVEIIADQLGVKAEKVTMDARFREDLEADSLDLVELMMAFEEEFGGEISDEQAQKVATVGEVVALLKAAGAGDED